MTEEKKRVEKLHPKEQKNAKGGIPYEIPALLGSDNQQSRLDTQSCKDEAEVGENMTLCSTGVGADWKI